MRSSLKFKVRLSWLLLKKGPPYLWGGVQIMYCAKSEICFLYLFVLIMMTGFRDYLRCTAILKKRLNQLLKKLIRKGQSIIIIIPLKNGVLHHLMICALIHPCLESTDVFPL